MNLLIVEDEKKILDGTADMVRDFNFSSLTNIYTETNPENAVRTAQKNDIHILITDINMKPFDGLELIRIIRELNPKIRVIIVSGYAEFDYAKKSLNLGVSNYILKPIDDEELKTSLGRCIEELESKENLTDSRLVNKAIEYIKENFLETPSLSLVAEELGVSYSYLSRIFKGYTGQNFRDYLMTLRMEYAANELQEHPDKKIYELANELGYISVRDFSSAFRKQFGILPVNYRGGERKNKN